MTLSPSHQQPKNYLTPLKNTPHPIPIPSILGVYSISPIHHSTKQPVWPSRPIHIFVPLDQRVCAHLRRLIIGSAAHSNAKVSRRAHTSHLPEFIRHIKPERNESTRIFAVSNQSPHISAEFGRLRCKLFVAAVQSIEYWNHHIGLWKQYPHNTYLPFVCVVAVVADVAFVCLVLCVGWRDHRRAVL